MRMSCNGCRVLRKGCSDSCSIRPCLQWINNPESQANATVFLAKFYGRAGLINLINAGPDHLRPAIFRSLLYEACGRMVNPIYGSVGLLWSGSWQLCQAAVEAVLKGDPIVQLPPGSAYDIRHANKLDPTQVARPAADLHKPRRTRSRFKRTSAASAARARGPAPSPPEEHESEQDRWYCPPMETTQFQRARSHDHESSASHATEAAVIGVDKEEESSMFSHVSQGEPVDGELGLELTLGFEPTPPQSRRSPGESSSPMDQMMTTGWENDDDDDDDDDDSCRVRLGLELPPAASHHSKHDCTGDSSVN